MSSYTVTGVSYRCQDSPSSFPVESLRYPLLRGGDRGGVPSTGPSVSGPAELATGSGDILDKGLLTNSTIT